MLQELTSSKATELVHQIANRALKWTTANGVDASLLVIDAAGVRDAMVASELVQSYFSAHESWREPTRRVLTALRKDAVLNPHGRDGGGVGQNLKTVSAALLCIGVLEDVGGDWGALPIEASDGAEAWDDIAWPLLNEFHSNDALALLLLAVIVQLKEQNDPRVREMRVALVTATRDGPIVAAAEQFLKRKGVTLPSVTMPHLAEPPLKPHLWSVVPVPLGWKEMRDDYDRAVLTARLMSEWIMGNWGESAVILFLSPGDHEQAWLMPYSDRFSVCLTGADLH